MLRRILVCFCAAAFAGLSQAQVNQSAPLTLTLQDALARAQLNAPQFLAAVSDINAAHEDLLQAKGARGAGQKRYLAGGRPPRQSQTEANLIPAPMLRT